MGVVTGDAGRGGEVVSRPRRRYDDKFRASAVVMLEAAGYPDREGSLAEVARHIGMPHNTLRNWYHSVHNPPPSDVRQEKKEDLVIELEKVAHLLVKAIPDKIEDATLQQVATSMGITIDKLQLLKGQPTLIVELTNLLKEGAITRQDILDEFADEPEAAQGLFESIGLQAIETREAPVEGAAK